MGGSHENNSHNPNRAQESGFGALCQGTLNLHLLSRHSQGLCRCLWPNQSHRSSQCYYQLEGCSEQPSPDECTKEKGQRRLGELLGSRMVQAYRFSSTRRAGCWVCWRKEWKPRTGMCLRSVQPQKYVFKANIYWETDEFICCEIWLGSTTLEWFLTFGYH